MPLFVTCSFDEGGEYRIDEDDSCFRVVQDVGKFSWTEANGQGVDGAPQTKPVVQLDKLVAFMARAASLWWRKSASCLSSAWLSRCTRST